MIVKKYKFPKVLIVLSIFLIGIVSAISFTDLFNYPNPLVTSNSSVNLGWNFTTDTLQNLTFNWDGTNTTLYDDSLVLFMNFDNRSELGENSTYVADLSKYGNNGTVVGGENISWTENGKYGGAFNFSRNYSYINSSKVFNVSSIDDFTMSVWFKTKSPSATQIIMGKYGSNTELLLYLSGSNLNGQLRGINALGETTATGGTITTNWHQGVFVRNTTSDKLYLYLDNILVNSQTDATSGTIDTGIDFLIGAKVGSTNYFNGSIDDVMIFNRSLSASEISQLYKTDCTKYNQTNWGCNFNQSLNAVLNSSVTSYNFPYQICVSNSSSSENCTSQKVITQTIPNKNVVANFSSSVGNIRNDFYGANTHGNWLGTSRSIDIDNDGIKEGLSDLNWHRQWWFNSAMKYARGDMSLGNYYSSDGTIFTLTGDLTNVSANIKWFHDNGFKILYIVDSPPSGLRNTTSGYCTTLSPTCQPTNATLFGKIVVDFINRTTLDGLYADAIEIEVLNEPAEKSSFLNNLSEDAINMSIRSVEYNKIYNATYLAIKSAYPTIQVGGGGDKFLSGFPYREQMMINLICNFTNSLDFLTPHVDAYNSLDSSFIYSINNIFSNATACGSNLNRISFVEVYEDNMTVTNNSVYNSVYSKTFASAYSTVLNLYPNNISFVIYQWSDPNNYDIYSAEYPDLFYMVSEPNLDNVFKPTYNVTKNFAHLCPAGGSVYSSSSDDDELKTVTCKDGNNYNIIVINTGTDSKNVSLDATGFIGTKTYMMDISNGNLYLNNNSNQLGIKDSYDITYLVAPDFTINENSNLTKISPTGESYLDNSIYFINSTISNKHIASTLGIGVTSNITFNVESCDNVGNIYYTPKGGSRTLYQREDYSCLSNQVTINNLLVNPSLDSNELEIEYGCSSLTRSGYSIVMILASVMLIMFVATIVWKGFQAGTLSLGQLIMLFVSIIVCLALWLASGQNLGASCGVVG